MLMDELHQSHDLLVEGLRLRGVNVESPALSVEFYSHVMAAFECNCMTIQARTLCES